MQKMHSKIAKGVSDERVWMLEHPPVYTGGTSATKNDLLNIGSIPTHLTGRGGQWTYHRPWIKNLLAYARLIEKAERCS